MGVVLLRPERCLNCGGAMPTGARIDRRYCKSSCRTLAYRIRKRTGALTDRRIRAPRWAEGQPVVIGSALAALAELQARVLHLAHHLEQDDIAYRHPCSGDVRPVMSAAPPAAADQALVMRVQQAEAALHQAHAETAEVQARAQAAQQRIERLQHELQQAQTEKTAADRRTADAEQRQYALDDELRGVRDILTERQATIHQLRTKLEQAQDQQGQAREQTLALDAARRKEATLLQDLAWLQGENKAFQRSAKQVAKMEAQLVEMATRAGEWQALETSLRAQLAEATRKADASKAELDKSRQIVKEAPLLIQTIAAQQRKLSQEQQDRAALQDEIVKLQPPAVETDPLIRAMKEKVRRLHQLGVCQKKASRLGYGPLFPYGPALTGFPLDSYDEATVRSTAIQMALERRRELYYKSFGKKPTWVQEDYLLDPDSERRLLKKVDDEVNDLARDLQHAKMRIGDSF